MAMLVLMQFDDDEEALNFVEAAEAEGKKVPAIYKMPTMFHDLHGGGKTQTGFTKGQKYGWWVCSTCMKPSRYYWESVVNKECSFGKNIKSLFFTEETSD